MEAESPNTTSVPGYSGKGWTVCPQCGLRKRGFWATEFDATCVDCSELNAKHAEEERLRKAVASGKVKVSDLTEFGRKVCGIIPNAKGQT